MLEIKRELYNYCLRFAEERINAAEQAIKDAQDASVNDTKSSAGDKYETTREMMQQEISRNQAQLTEARKLKHALNQINPDKKYDSVQNGSLVITDNGAFYLSISAGQIKHQDKIYFAISAFSPVGRNLMGLKKGDAFAFNGKKFEIIDLA